MSNLHGFNRALGAILIRALVFILLLYCPIIQARWVSPEGKQLKDTAAQKSQNGFDAHLVLVSDAAKLQTDWGQPTAGVNILETDTVARNAEINAFIVFGGCGLDVNGNCNVTMHFNVTAPDGSTYAKVPHMEVWKNRRAPPAGTLQLSVGYLKMIFSPGEQLGEYTVNVDVQDNNTRQTMSLQSKFRAVETAK